MKATKLKIIQRKRLADTTSQVTENIYKHRVKLVPVFGLLAALAGLVFLRLQPQTSKYVSQFIETSLGAVEHLSVLWSPITLLVALSLAALMYMWMDYKHHKIPLIRINHRVKYNFWHHLHVAFFPRFKYRWRPAFYWLAVAQVSAAVFIATVAVVGVPAAKAFSGTGLGSAEDPYIILNCSQLQEMRDDLDGHYELGGPIDCSDTVNWNGGDGFIAIGGGDGQQFRGSLDGKGFSIDGLYQRVGIVGHPLSLLGFTEDATIANLKLTSVDIEDNRPEVPIGALTAIAYNSQISDVYVSGIILAASHQGRSMTGGVFGSLAYSSAARVSANVNITNNSADPEENDFGKASMAGGLTVVSYLSTITDSYTSGSISGTFAATTGGTAMHVGGLAAQLVGGSVHNSYSNTSISVTRDINAVPAMLTVGGLVAIGAGAEINNSFASGQQNISVGPMELEGRGGLIGLVAYDPDPEPPLSSNITGSQNYFDTTATQPNCIGAYTDKSINGYAPDQTPPGFCSPVNTGNSQPNYFNNNSSNAPFTVAGSPVWDFTNIWKTQANGPPIFLWQGPQVPALPGQVRNLTSTSASSTSLSAQWLVPVFSGNTPITNYVVQYKLHSDTNWTAVSRSPSATTSQLITGLVAGQMYDIRVAAINAVGQGDWRVTENVSTSQLPTAPQNFAITYLQGTNEFGDFEDYYFPQLNWQVPAEGQPITDYVIQYKVTPGPDWDEISEDLENDGVPWVTGDWVTANDGTNTNLTKNGMDNVDTYLTMALLSSVPGELHVVDSVEFRVAAVNSYGQGAWTGIQSFQAFVGLTACQQMHDMLDQHALSRLHLMNNIDCSDTVNWNGGTGWQPIDVFRGILDGRGFTVSDLTINNPTLPTDTNYAMISTSNGATVQNLTMTNAQVTNWNANETATAVLIGLASPDTVLTNLSVGGAVRAASISNFILPAGGIVGTVTDFEEVGTFSGTITWSNLIFDGTVMSPGSVGGLAGGIDVSGATMIFQDIQTHGQMRGTQEIGGVIGGLVNATKQPVQFVRVNSDMTITGRCMAGGGLIGAIVNTVGGTLSDSSYVNGVTITSSSYNGTMNCHGTNLGYFKEPKDIALDSQDRVYVSDRLETGNIHRLYSGGDPLDQWGTVRPSDTEDSPPVNPSLAFGTDGLLYIADMFHNEIRVYNADGEWQRSWTSSLPTGIAIDANNNIYVVGGDWPAHEVRKYSSTGVLQDTWVIPTGNGPGQVGHLTNIAVAPNGNLAVTDNQQNSVHILANNGTYLQEIDGTSSPAGNFGDPSVHIDDSGTMYILDRTYSRLLLFDSSYNYIEYWGEGGVGNSDIEGVSLTTAQDNSVYVLGSTVKHYSGSGILVDQWGGMLPAPSLGMESTVTYAGGLVGLNFGNPLTITGSTSTGVIQYYEGVVGGLVGQNLSPDVSISSTTPTSPQNALVNGLKVINSSSSMNIENGDYPLLPNGEQEILSISGGIVGMSQEIDIVNSSTSGDTTVGTNNPRQYPVNGFAGGMVGSFRVLAEGTAMGYVQIHDSSTTGNIVFNTVGNEPNLGTAVGGVVGYGWGWMELDSVHASGDIGVVSDNNCPVDQCNYPTVSYSGGLVGASLAGAYVSGGSNIELSTEPVVITNSYATGDITSDNIDSASVIGGVAGSLQAMNLQIDTVHATGNVTTLQDDSRRSISTAGGLAGNLEAGAASSIQSVYATGNVTGSSNYPSMFPFLVEAAGGLFGTLAGPLTLQKSYASGSVLGGGSVGGLIGMSAPYMTLALAYGDLDPNSSRSIINTYATGNVGGVKSYFYDVNQGHMEIGTAVGGLIGTLINTSVQKSYASGDVSNQQPTIDSAYEQIENYLYGAATGGLIGRVSTPFGSSVFTNQVVLSDSFSAVTMLDQTNNQKGYLIGMFSASAPAPVTNPQPSVNLTNFIHNTYYDATRSGSLNCSNERAFNAAEQPEDVTDVIFALNNPSVCIPVNPNNQTPSYFKNNTTNPPLNSWDFTTPVWYQHLATYPTFQPGETVPGPPRDLGGTPTTSSMVLTWNPPSTDGGSPITDYRIQYRLNGTNDWIEYSHPPSSTITSYTIPGLISGQRYDFQVSALNAVGQSAWVLGIYDVLIPGGSPTNPTTPVTSTNPGNPTTNPTTSRRPTRPTGSTPVTTTPAIPTDPNSPDAAANTPRHLDVNRLPENLPGLASFARKPSKVNLLPYFFLSWLLLLALYFAYRAWREYRYQQAMVALIANTKATSQAVSNFLAITTHYVNTPLSILKGAIELIASKHALQPDFVKQFQAKLLGLQTTTTNLVAQAEQGLTLGATATSATPAVTTTTVATADQQATKQLWLPLLGIASAIAITDIVLLLTKSYGHSWARMLNHLIWAVAGTAIVMVTYWFWKKQKQLQASTRQQLHTERTLLANKNQFLGTAATSLTTHAAQLRVGTAGLEQFPDTKLLTNGLGMLDRLASSLTKAQRFATLSPALPRLNVRQVYQQDIAPALSQQATEAGASLQDNLPADLMLQMQPDELTHILGTTIDNAIQYGGTSTNVSTDTTTNTTPANNTAATNVVQVSGHPGRSKATLTVKDNGSGIAPDIQAHLFEPLTRGTDTSTFDHQGLGLNLYLTRLILQKYGGNIHLTSQPQQGTTVTMTMPNSHTDPTGLAPQVVVPKG